MKVYVILGALIVLSIVGIVAFTIIKTANKEADNGDK